MLREHCNVVTESGCPTCSLCLLHILMKHCNDVSCSSLCHSCQNHNVPVNIIQWCVCWSNGHWHGIHMVSCFLMYNVFHESCHTSSHWYDNLLGPRVVERLPHLCWRSSPLAKWLLQHSSGGCKCCLESCFPKIPLFCGSNQLTWPFQLGLQVH
jgi:hypothetical protein